MLSKTIKKTKYRKKMGLGAGPIAGIVIACVIVVAVIVLVVVFEHYKKVKPTFSTSNTVACNATTDCPTGQVCATGTNTCTAACAADTDCTTSSSTQQNSQICVNRQCVVPGTVYLIDLSGNVNTWSGDATKVSLQKLTIPFPVTDIVALPNDGSISKTGSAPMPIAVVIRAGSTGASLYSLFANGSVSQLQNALPAKSISLVNTPSGQQWILTTKDPNSNASDVYTFNGSANAFLNSTASQWSATTQSQVGSTTITTQSPVQGIKIITGARTPQGLSPLGNAYFAVSNDNILYGSNDLITWSLVVNINETSSTPECNNPQFLLRSIAYDTARDRYLVVTPTNDICFTNPAIGESCDVPQYNCTATVPGSSLPTNLQTIRYY